MLIFTVAIFSLASVTFAMETLTNVAWNISNTIIAVGYSIAVGMLIYIGIKYITGAADAKANMKSAIVNYLIGAFLVFCATTVASIVINLSAGGGASNSTSDSLADTIINSIK